MRTTARALLVVGLVVFAVVEARAECPLTEIVSGLRMPLGITESNHGNLIVSESGTPAPNTGRISIVDRHGNRRTLVDGLPSGINDVGEPSGPAGVFLRGDTLYVAIGVGDVGSAGPVPGTTMSNPNPSSPIFSSVLAIHFSRKVETSTAGFALTVADHEALAAGEALKLSNGRSDNVTVELITNFLPDFTPNPLPFFLDNIRVSNPFQLVGVGHQLYVTDGGQNLVRRVDIPTGSFSTLAAFPDVPNPLGFPGPFVEAVPTGIRSVRNGKLLVTLFRGFPFPDGTSVVEELDRRTGVHTTFISGLKTAIDVLEIGRRRDTDYLVLQHTSGAELLVPPGPPLPGLLLRFERPGGPPTILADCLARPTSMALDEESGTLYVTELAGRIVAIPVQP